MLYVTGFTIPNFKIVIATVFYVWAIFLTEFSNTINLKLSTNDKDITNGVISITVLKTSLIKIKIKISETNNFSRMPFQSFFHYFYICQ